MSRAARAEIQRYRPRKVEGIVTRERAVLPCGCCIYVGRDAETQAVATGASACGDYHWLVTEHASELLRESLTAPTKRLLVDVCAELLSKAAREAGL